MKKFGLIYFIPLIIAILCLYFGSTKVNSIFFKKEINIAVDSSYRYIENFRNNTFYEDQFLLNNDSCETIFILGSSELTVSTESMPFDFISNNFKTKLKGIGHAGNQCFSIYSQLLANENRLKDAPIVIVLSPGWFHSGSADGTTSSLFLEFNSSRFLNAILQNDSSPLFKKYEIERISKFSNEIGNPNLSIRLFNLEKKSSENFLQKCFYFPIIAIEKLLNKINLELLNANNTKNNSHIINRELIATESVVINWDSLFMISKQEQINNSSNNKWCIDNDYFNKYIKGKTSNVVLVKDENNQELKDFRMLIKLLKTKKVNASFIILPLNPYFYTNSNQLTPLINTLEHELNRNNFPCLNFWNPDSTNFDKGILKDVMHLSGYGWYKADKFIIETYKLAK